MLIRFQFSNFASYRDLQTISWVASSLKHPHRDPIAAAGTEHGILPCCAIYGANASGKSNAIKALRFFVDVIDRSYRRWAPEQPVPIKPFFTGGETKGQESKFVLDFTIEDVQYQYGFQLDESEVVEEWLHVYPIGRKQIWFHRLKGSAIQFGPKLKGPNRAVEQLTRKNSLFLSAAAQQGHDQLGQVHFRLMRMVVFDRHQIGASLRRLANWLQRHEDHSILRLIKAADLGIVELDRTEEEPRHMATERQPELPGLFPSAPAILGPVTGKAIVTMKIPTVRFVHEVEGNALVFEANMESDGTLIYASRLPGLLQSLKFGGVYVVDELDRSLHPALCLQIVKLFLSPDTNPKKAQLLFTTHDTTLLSSGNLRRDEIWFAEKKPDGASELYALSDFSPRKNENLERGYLQGRYGSVPVLNEASFLNALRFEDKDV